VGLFALCLWCPGAIYCALFVQQAGIDLSLLTSALSLPEALEELDEPWVFETLLESVSQAMQAEVDKKEAEEKDATITTATAS
jgi:hypothetical protein